MDAQKEGGTIAEAMRFLAAIFRPVIDSLTAVGEDDWSPRILVRDSPSLSASRF